MEELFLNKKTQGFGLIEVIISIALVTIFLVTFTTLTLESMKTSRINSSELKAIMYLEELIEVAKDLEQSDWDQLINSSCYNPDFCYPAIQDNKWILLTGQEELDDTYQRFLSLENVYRNQLSFPNEIVSSGGVLDPNTKKVITKILWNNGFSSRDLTLESYLYDYQP